MYADDPSLNSHAEQIIGCAFTVANARKTGFAEKVYDNALAHELTKSGLRVEQQYGVTVYYDGVIVGVYAADMLVENAVLVELKAVKALDAAHGAQCLNYLAATGLRLCLLLNFGNPRIEVKRLINGRLNVGQARAGPGGSSPTASRTRAKIQSPCCNIATVRGWPRPRTSTQITPIVATSAIGINAAA